MSNSRVYIAATTVKDTTIKGKPLSSYPGYEDFGYGVFAKRIIAENTVLGEYKGYMSMDYYWEDERQKSSDKRNKRWRYTFHTTGEIDGHSVIIAIDAYNSACYFGRYINGVIHDEDGKYDESKLNVKYIHDDRLSSGIVSTPIGPVKCSYHKILIVTTKRIEKNEELIVDYGRSYWDTFLFSY